MGFTNWSSGTQPSSTSGNITNNAAELNKSITLEAGDYKFRYSIRLAIRSGGRYNDVDASGNTTQNFVQTTTTGLDYSYTST